MILKVTSRIARWGRLLFLPFIRCSRTHLPDRNLLVVFIFASGCLFISTSQNLHAMQLSSDTQLSTAGYYQMLWSGKAKIFLLQESETADFKNYKVIYEGTDLARVISGKPNGDYFYRVKDDNDPRTSNVVKVTVAHHSLKNAILFFIAGAIVFILTLIFIIKGNRQNVS